MSHLNEDKVLYVLWRAVTTSHMLFWLWPAAYCERYEDLIRAVTAQRTSGHKATYQAEASHNLTGFHHDPFYYERNAGDLQIQDGSFSNLLSGVFACISFSRPDVR
jgi:hypothetical protein